MATIEEMLNKKSAQRKPFKKISYKPWESSFLSENETSEIFDDEKIERELNGEGGESGDSNKLQSVVSEKKDIVCPSLVILEEYVAETRPLLEASEPQKQEKTSNTDDFFSNQMYPLPEEANESVSHISNVDHCQQNQTLLVSPEMREELLSKKPFPNQKMPIFRIQSLMGIPRLIMFELIKKEEYRDDYFVYFEAISKLELAELCDSVAHSVATSIARLKERGCLFSVDGKRGRGGYSVYSMPLFIFYEIEKWKRKNSE